MGEIDIERYIERQHIARNIFCPYCGQEQDQETMYHHVTYWGEEGWKFCSCADCGKDFEVEEKVTRTFESRKISEVEE